MTTVDHDLLIATLDQLKLTATRDQFDTLLDEAARSKKRTRCWRSDWLSIDAKKMPN